MSAELDQLNTFGDGLLAACREQLATLPVTKYGPVNVTKRTSDAMRYEVSEVPQGYRFQLFAPGSILTLIFGRQPGKFPPLLDIQQWIEDRNIVPHPDAKGHTVSKEPGKKGYSPLAFLFARAIATKGNTVHQQGHSDLFQAILSADNVSAALKTHFVPLLVGRVVTALNETILA